MKVSVCCWIIASSVIMAGAHAVSGQTVLDKRISLTVSPNTLDKALEQLRAAGKISLYYDQQVVKKIRVGRSDFRNETVAGILNKLLHQTNLIYHLSGNGIIIQAVVGNKKNNRAPKPGIVTGQVIDEDSGEPLIGTTVLVKNSTLGTVADVEGKYRLSLEPGNYDIEFRFVGYQVKVIVGVIVSEGQVNSLNVTMAPEASRLGEVVITSEYSKASVEGLLMKQKNNVSMTDGMSAEQIKATPDNNTAQVLRRVSGVTVQNDKFVTIRGLSDRYNNVLINGASAPSTEPNRRNFSFDIVPSALVDNVVVNKTASPDLPGEFTGGMVMINTKEIPDKDFVSFTYGRGINTNATGKSMISSRRDKHAELGIVDEEKKWYGDGRLFDPPKYLNYLFTRDQHRIDSIGSRVPNRWQLYRYPYVPMQNYQLSAGIVRDLKNSKLGFTSALTYRNEQTIESGEFAPMFNEGYVFSSQRYRYNTNIGALLNAAYKSGGHRFSWKNLYNNRYSNQFDDQFGYDFEGGLGGAAKKRTSDVTLANRLIQSRLEGEHSITRANIRFDWNADITNMLREQPDGRFMAGLTGIGGGFTIRDPALYTNYNFNRPLPHNGGLFGARLVESKETAGANIAVPFQVLRGRQIIKAGYNIAQRENDYNGTFFRIAGSPSGALNGLPIHQLVTPERFAAGIFRYEPVYVTAGGTGDRYEGNQTLKAYYGMVDLTFLKKFRATGGVRYEDNRMEVQTTFYNTSGYGVDSINTYVDRDWLPSMNLIFSITKKFNIRASYSKTLARPDFVERSPYLYYDFAENLTVTGQQALEASRITNYDFRLEYYFTPGEIVSASVFYKEFSKPVERFFFMGTADNGVQYRNLHSAEARGIEFNFIKSLNFTGLADHWTTNLFLSGNFAIMEGSIRTLVNTKTSSGQDTTFVSSYKRPVQGLSPYTINGGLAYQSAKWGLNVSYNKFGRRIVNGGTTPHHVQYEVPRDVMDVQFNWQMLQKKLIARVNISDLFNQPFVVYANAVKKADAIPGNGDMGAPNEDPKGDAYNPAYDYVTYNTKRGTNYSFSLTYTF